MDTTSRPSLIGRLAIPLAVLLIGAAASVFAFHTAAEQNRTVAQLRLGVAIDLASDQFQGYIRAQEQVATAFAGFLGASETVSQAEFERFAERVVPAYPSLVAVNWFPRIAPGNADDVEETLRAAGAERPFLRDANGTRIDPATLDRDAFPVLLTTPLAANRPLLGFDVASSPLRRPALEQARDTAQAVSSEPVTLVQQPGVRGTNLYMPVYRAGAAPAGDVPARRDALAGYVSVAFRLDKLVQDALPQTHRPFRIHLFDADAAADQSYLGTVGASEGTGDAADPQRPDRPDLERRTVSWGQRQWVLVFDPLSGALQDSEAAYAPLVLVLGLLLTVGLAAYLALQARGAAAMHRARDEAERAHGEAEAARLSAEQANVAKTRFLAAASHDLRQPLQSLFLFSSALGAQVQGDKAKRTLVMLERGLETLKALLDSLLDVSRLDAGVIEPEIATFPLGNLLLEMHEAYAPVAASQGLELIAGSGCDVAVRSDPNLLGRVLRNYVENALRYTEHGQIRLECCITGGAVRIEVHDTGIGIPDDQQARIFEEFHQVGNPERDRGQGLGLGLAIVKRIAHLLGHPITLASTPGRGSVFSVEVPIETGHVAVPPRPARPAPANDERPRFAVLVDDDAIVLLGLQAMFGEWGYDVLIAGSTDQVMEKLEVLGRRPDIVVADYRLREGRVGTEAILRIRERFGRTIPGIILTGETGPECHHDAAAHGFHVAHKPVTPGQLQSTVNRFLDAAE